jgi:type IV pilus assembly protein PilM
MLGSWRRKVSQGPMRLLNQAPPVAIDFGVGSLKILQVSAGPPLSLVAAACLETPDDLLSDHAQRLEFQAEALPRLVRSCGFSAKRAVCAIPAGMAFCKHLRFPSGDAATVSAMVRSSIAGQLGCDQGALVFRYAEVAPGAVSVGPGKTEQICMAVSRDLVSRLMETIKTSRLEPVGMHSEHLAVVRSFDAIAVGPSEEPEPAAILVLDIGAGTTKVTIAHGDDVAFSRTVELGGRHIDAAVARQGHCDLGEARVQRLAMRELTAAGAREAAAASSVALLPAPKTSAPEYDVTEPLEILTDEVALSLRYHRSLYPDKPVGRVMFVGGEARHQGLCLHLARALRLPAQVADPMTGVARGGNETTVGVDFKLMQPGWAMALGLCLCPTDL